MFTACFHVYPVCALAVMSIGNAAMVDNQKGTISGAAYNTGFMVPPTNVWNESL